MVPLVEVFGSGRAVMETDLISVQEVAPAISRIAMIKIFIISDLYNYL